MNAIIDLSHFAHSMDDMNQIDYCRKVLMREFERFFPELSLDGVTVHTFPTPKEQYHAWILETLIWTCARLKEGNANREAMRGYAQAREYRGRHGGFWPSSTVSDAAATIQNALEDLL